MSDWAVQRSEAARSEDASAAAAAPIAVTGDARRLKPDESGPGAAVEKSEAAKTLAGIPAGSLNAITTWVPTEVIGVWIAVLPIMPAVDIPAGKPVCDGDYGDRWVLFGVLTVLMWFLVIAFTALKRRQSATLTGFQMPWLGLVLTTVAWLLWVFALVESPINDVCGVEDWHRVLAISVGGIVIGTLTALLRKKPEWSLTNTQSAPPGIVKQS